MISDEPVFFNFGSTITHICAYIWLHAFQYLCVLYYYCCYNVCVFRFTGSLGYPDLDQTYPVGLSDDLREDALHDLLQRIDIREDLVPPNPWSGRETEL